MNCCGGFFLREKEGKGGIEKERLSSSGEHGSTYEVGGCQDGGKAPVIHT